MSDIDLNEEKAASNIFYAFTKALRQYFKFRGRTCRYDYWGFCFVCLLINILFGILVSVVPEIAIVYMVCYVLLIIPMLSLFSRRLHDVNKSFFKWYVLPLLLYILGLLYPVLDVYLNLDLGIIFNIVMIVIGFYIVICGICCLVFVCRKGNPEANIYGEPIEETEHQRKVSKWLIFFTLIVPVIVALVILIVGGISGYNEAMQNYQSRQLQYNMNVDNDDTNNMDNAAEVKSDETEVEAKEETASEPELNKAEENEAQPMENEEEAVKDEAKPIEDEAESVENEAEPVENEAEPQSETGVIEEIIEEIIPNEATSQDNTIEENKDEGSNEGDEEDSFSLPQGSDENLF